jgi:hypothetical protein
MDGLKDSGPLDTQALCVNAVARIAIVTHSLALIPSRICGISFACQACHSLVDWLPNMNLAVSQYSGRQPASLQI